MNGFIKSIKQFKTWGPHLYGYINLVPPHQGSQLGSSWVQVSICKFIYTWGLVLIRFKPRSETHKHTHTVVCFTTICTQIEVPYFEPHFCCCASTFSLGTSTLIVGQCPMFAKFILRVCESYH